MKIKFFDGSMGTMLQSAGLKAGELPELLNLTDEEKVFAVHKAYAEIGSEYITTNTFGANSLKMDNYAEVISKGVEIARRAGKKVALDIGPTGKLLKPMGDLDFEKAIEVFAQVVNAG
ncbi:MAG: homocysteine S-methyltransferase family protein, partial [Eubacterium sp.]|nr:homocysteine S-methyltransferase family protein [Eubacterium sp.]